MFFNTLKETYINKDRGEHEHVQCLCYNMVWVF